MNRLHFEKRLEWAVTGFVDEAAFGSPAILAWISPKLPPMSSQSRYTGPAMSLANMRQNGMTAVAVECACGRRESVDVSGLPGTIEVPALKRLLRCSVCGSRPSDVRPDRSQHRANLWP